MSEEMMAEIYAYSMIWGEFINVILTIVGFIFKAIAIHTMAKRAGLKQLYLAYIPFANYILLGRLIGKVIIWRQPVKNMGVWLMIVGILAFITNTLYNLDVYVIGFAMITELLTGRVIETIVLRPDFLNQLLIGEGGFYIAVSIVNAVLTIAKIFLEVNLIFSIFKKYRPDKAFLFAIVSIFIEFTFGFLLFSVRKNKPMTYEEYLQYMARKRGYMGGYYGENPYNRGGYDRAPYNPPSQKDENPFPEFDDGKGDNNGGSSNPSDDDLFN